VSLLALRDVETSYGASQVLFGVSLDVGQGVVVTLLGRNGVGKTTTVRSVMGLTPPRAGTIALDGHAIHGLPPYRVAQAGIGLVPEGRQVFPNLTVHENLVATAATRSSTSTPWTVGRVFELFPGLRARASMLAATLSGGEQQMLAIGRALMTNPRLLILDEATEGLAPLVRRQIWRCLEELKATGLAILLIDKNVDALIRLADRHYIVEKGIVVWTGTSSQLAADVSLRSRFLGV
jgi:branched-chain amino acid transport system ATP-binding protein